MRLSEGNCNTMTPDVVDERDGEAHELCQVGWGTLGSWGHVG
ncbi:hypothetical protein [Thalassoroseus pseudoceratinae]|nr:hypothetical protein [Thalassoroseus pseudoceratinae]